MVVKRRSPAPSPGLKLLIVAGVTLVIGLGLGALLYRVIHQNKARPKAPTLAAPRQPAAVLTPPPLPKPKGPAPGLPAATQFDFYTILPEIHRKTEGIFPHAHPTTRHQPPRSVALPRNAPTPKMALVGGRFILQAASFPNIAYANRLRAKLALRGLTSYIEKVSITGRGAFYRVRLGPLHIGALGHDRRILARLGLKPILLREARGN
ncbi:MAG: SPOR domain-containing protein [Acidiferrobacter sp.]